MIETAKIAILLTVFTLVARTPAAVDTRSAEVLWDSTNGRFSFANNRHPHKLALARGTFTNSIISNGWGFLDIKTNSLGGLYLDYHQAYAAGLLEARLTHELIGMQYRNEFSDYCKGQEAYCAELKEFLNTNLDYMFSMAEKHSFTDPYWHHVALSLVQLAGMEAGMSMQDFYIYVGENFKPNVSAAMFLTMAGDFEDLEKVFGKEKEYAPGAFSSCSTLIKLTEKNADILAGHATWTGYNSMLRIQKKFTFEFHETFDSSVLIPGNSVSFSSYPGSVISRDDFYLTSSKLLVTETTIENNNPELYKFTTYQTVPSWIRTMVANRLASSTDEWAKLFAYNNSGTYNNQWMVIDYKRFKRGQSLQNGTFLVLEQMPGLVEHHDMTAELQKNGFWSSYNTPYFERIFHVSGQGELVKKYGDWYTYHKTPRALIFKRDSGSVKDLDSLRKLLRYNDFKNDPLSRCNCSPPYSGENGISSRSDLNPANGTYPFAALGPRSHGGTDVKVTKADMISTYDMIIQCGPTNDQQPTFKWSESEYGKTVPHEGHPDEFNFKPVATKWN